MSWSGIGTFATLDDRRNALRVAHAVLTESWPRVQVACRITVRGYPAIPAQAVFRLPGVVRVSLRDSGELIAQSLPGSPLEVDFSGPAKRAYGEPK